MKILTFDQSFATHRKSIYWSNKNELKPEDVFKCSGKKFIFNCNICSHEFKISLNNLSSNNKWCPYCSNRILCEKNCDICFQKSFALHEKSKFWSNKNELKPRNVFKSSGKKYWFDCNICNHDFECNINNIVSGNWCKYCSNQSLCKNIECKICFDKSFASHPKSKYWNNENILKPREIFSKSNKKIILNCENKHKFEITLYNIDNNWCPFCIKKTENKLLKYLETINNNIITQSKFDWCKNKTFLPFDFLIEDSKCLIELDGPQHFRQVSNWKSHEETQKRDKFKMKCAFENGYKIIRLIQNDVLHDIFDWKSELLNAINSNFQCIFICKNNEYINYKN